MTVLEFGEAAVSDHGVEREDFARAVIDGLSKPQKELPCRFFYDEAGSALFEDITRLDEYYPTRTEAVILRDCAAEIAARAAPDTVMVEFGSGSSTKTEILLDAMSQLAAYVAIDVSPSALEDAHARLANRFPRLRVETCVGDFAAPVQLPAICVGRPLLGFFPGSTIGNLTRSEATSLLKHFAGVLGPDAGMVIGVDLKKDPAILVPAYDDAAGVTAAFNLNLLARINRELGGNLELAQFMHRAVWNESAGRIEMHLVSRIAQSVSIEGRVFDFRKGETIHTENSHKYEVNEFAAMARAAGWATRQTWCDAQRLFSVHELVREKT
jgi:dimethylhistidine N-methyltransferase